MSAEEATRIARAVQRLKGSRRTLKIAVPTAAALGAGAAIAAAAIPGGDGTITGCYNGKTEGGVPVDIVINDALQAPGALRVIDPSQPHMLALPGGGTTENLNAVCVAGETEITWNQKGPQGPPGPSGNAGAQGPAGESGLPGETTFGFNNASGNMFLKLDGIKGESQDDKHKGDIEIESFSWGVGRGGSAPTGAGAGKTTVQSFKITKVLDKSSPLLLNAATTGKHIKEADLLFAHKAGGKETDYLEIKLENVLISSIQDGGSAKQEAPQENISLNFQKAEMIYLNNGKQQGKVKINFAANKAL